MKLRTLVVWGVFLGYAGFFLSGCATHPRKVRVPEMPSPSEKAGQQELAKMKRMTALPEISHVNQRLTFYEGRLAQWKEVENRLFSQGQVDKRPDRWRECGTMLEKIAKGYGALRKQYMQEKGLAGAAEKTAIDPWEINSQDIKYFESGCDAVVEAGKSIVGGEIPAKTEGPEAQLTRYASEGEYEKAIAAYRDLMLRHPERAADVKIKRIYGMALLRTRRIDAATRVLPQALEKLSVDNPDSWTQHRLIADLYFGAGQVKRARKEYEDLAAFFSSESPPEDGWNSVDLWVADQLSLFTPVESAKNEQGLTIFMTVMRSFITFDGKQMPESLNKSVRRLERIFPDSIFTRRARQILFQAEDQVKTWVRGRLDIVETHVAQKEFEKALAVLDMLLAERLPEELRNEVRKVKDDVILAEARESTTKQLIDAQSLAAKWDEAVNLFELRRYDEALAAFTVLLGTEYEEKARPKIQEASDIAAKKMRRQAAALFVQARRSGSLDRKKELFVESWKMLNQISAKYPMASSDILEKVLQNMQVIEDSIREIDPAILETLEKKQNDEKNEPEKNDQKIEVEEIL